MLNGQALTSADFQGALVQVLDSNGTPGTLAVNAVSADPMDPSGSTSLFTLTTMDPTTGAISNICNPDTQGLQAAIPLLGSWDFSGVFHQDGTFSFYCTSGVIAKCVRWGYRPWLTVNGTSLVNAHEACTRMARADYCGDGTTYTENGTQIDMYDNLGINSPSEDLSLTFEATWSPQGAYCISRARWINLQTLLTPGCQAEFELALQFSPINSSDLCLMQRIGSQASSALLSDRTGININL
jgi:hypothetical protein